MTRIAVALTAVAIAVVLAGCGSALSDDARAGEALVAELGCVVCHGEQDGIGPSWTGVWGTDRELTDGSTVVFDAQYVRASLLNPKGQIVRGFEPVMPEFSISEVDLAAITRYLEESG